MIRRFYSQDPNPATGLQEKVTGLRDHDGAWIINEIASTVAVNGYFYDKPGKHIGTVFKRGRAWDVKSAHGGNMLDFPTLSSAVHYLICWNRSL